MYIPVRIKEKMLQKENVANQSSIVIVVQNTLMDLVLGWLKRDRVAK